MLSVWHFDLFKPPSTPVPVVTDGPYGGSGGTVWSDCAYVVNGPITGIQVNSGNGINSVRFRYGSVWAPFRGGIHETTHVTDLWPDPLHIDSVHGEGKEKSFSDRLSERNVTTWYSISFQFARGAYWIISTFRAGQRTETMVPMAAAEVHLSTPIVPAATSTSRLEDPRERWTRYPSTTSAFKCSCWLLTSIIDTGPERNPRL